MYVFKQAELESGAVNWAEQGFVYGGIKPLAIVRGFYILGLDAHAVSRPLREREINYWEDKGLAVAWPGSNRVKAE